MTPQERAVEMIKDLRNLLNRATDMIDCHGGLCRARADLAAHAALNNGTVVAACGNYKAGYTVEITMPADLALARIDAQIAAVENVAREIPDLLMGARDELVVLFATVKP